MSELHISQSIADTLPAIVKQNISKLSPESQATFESEYKRKKRSPGVFLALAILFPIQFFLEGRVGLGLVFLLSFGGFGWWWLIDIFLVWGRTKAYNEELASTIMRDLKIMGSS